MERHLIVGLAGDRGRLAAPDLQSSRPFIQRFWRASEFTGDELQELLDAAGPIRAPGVLVAGGPVGIGAAFVLPARQDPAS